MSLDSIAKTGEYIAHSNKTTVACDMNEFLVFRCNSTEKLYELLRSLNEFSYVQ